MYLSWVYIWYEVVAFYRRGEVCVRRSDFCFGLETCFGLVCVCVNQCWAAWCELSFFILHWPLRVECCCIMLVQLYYCMSTSDRWGLGFFKCRGNSYVHTVNNGYVMFHLCLRVKYYLWVWSLVVFHIDMGTCFFVCVWRLMGVLIDWKLEIHESWKKMHVLSNSSLLEWGGNKRERVAKYAKSDSAKKILRRLSTRLCSMFNRCQEVQRNLHY